MKYFTMVAAKLSIWMDNMAMLTLVFMMFLVVTDVVLRIFGHPIIGTYEIVMILAGPLVAFAIPQTSTENQHIAVDFLVERIEKRSKTARRIVFVCTKALGVALFLLLTLFVSHKGMRMFVQGDLTDARRIVLYPVPFVMAFCCLVQCFVLLAQIFGKFRRGDNNE
jgi:TRAP-type C4-dicarboxylate transport system permease small subunit